MRWTVPNLLSLLRMGLVPVFIIALVDGKPLRALGIFLFAGITDALDGFIARRWGQGSLLGAYLDPMADKLMLTSAFVMLTIPGLRPGVTIPVWVTVLVLARDVFIVGVALVLHLTMGIKRFPPTTISKINTVLQMVAVLLVLLSGWRALAAVAEGAIYLVAATTLASGLTYILVASRRAEETHGAGRPPSPPAATGC